VVTQPSSTRLEPPLVHRSRAPLHAMLVTARPRQWLKNLLVIAAAGAAGALGHDDVPVRVALAFAAFCMLASGIYAVNDVRDADEDRLHPRKYRRPVAAGEISPTAALITGVGSIAAGLLLSLAISPLLALVSLSYVALTVTYTLVWRNVFLLDIIAIAGGFVLRALAGGVAAPVTLSRWFILVVTFAALLVAAGKRYAELTRSGRPPRDGRRVLRQYNVGTLRMILWLSGAGAVLAYCMWAVQATAPGTAWRIMTIIPFVAALGRYGELLASGGGETPEDLVLRDRPLLLLSLAWLILFALSVHAAG
jgi:decaprenyl-phosphate phosphoribosyltransferase